MVMTVEHNEAILKGRGFRRVDGWNLRCPSPHGRPKRKRDRIPYDWEDHCYMLKHEELPTVYVPEPYHLECDDFVELAELVKDGWHVQISEGLSLWNPGQTIPIWITKAKDLDLLDSYTGEE